MFVLSVSYGNDSIAMIQWAHENGLIKVGPVHVVYYDPAWAEDIKRQCAEAGVPFYNKKTGEGRITWREN